MIARLAKLRRAVALLKQLAPKLKEAWPILVGLWALITETAITGEVPKVSGSALLFVAGMKVAGDKKHRDESDQFAALMHRAQLNHQADVDRIRAEYDPARGAEVRSSEVGTLHIPIEVGFDLKSFSPCNRLP